MIRNNCTTVLLIWFQGGFDALLYSFHFLFSVVRNKGQQIVDICCYYISPHGGVLLNVTVKHYIKFRLHFSYIQLFTFHRDCFTPICQLGFRMSK